jgi:hemolysin III
VVLVVLGALAEDAWKVISFSIYAATLLLMYSSSTLYHNARKGSRLKQLLCTLDYSAIYLLIAGTYTPFALVSLRGPWGWSLFSVVWGLALVGILQELWLPRKTRLISLVIYVLMGWIAVIAVVPLVETLSWHGFAWLVAGGLAYTIGIVFYINDQRFRHWHGIWHLFVLAGSALHYFAILLYVA